MKIEKALEQLDALTALTQRVTLYDGLRATPIAFTGCIGLIAGLIQAIALPSPSGAPLQFVMLWTAAATCSMLVVLCDMLLRYLRDPTARARRMTLSVLNRLAPALAVGAGLTPILLFYASDACWMLPGLWSALLGVGIASACSLLPSHLKQVAAWYIGSGFCVLSLGPDYFALHPLTMVIPFGGGQFLTAFLVRSTEPQEQSSNG